MPILIPMTDADDDNGGLMMAMTMIIVRINDDGDNNDNGNAIDIEGYFFCPSPFNLASVTLQKSADRIKPEAVNRTRAAPSFGKLANELLSQHPSSAIAVSVGPLPLHITATIDPSDACKAICSSARPSRRFGLLNPSGRNLNARPFEKHLSGPPHASDRGERL